MTDMPEGDISDWRLQGQEEYLAGAVLTKKAYQAPRPDWDHDHCSFCWTKFSEMPDDLRIGYATQDDYYWVCERCFIDFRERFQWIVQD